jgi:ubiquitin C-terminal hydrolase
VLVDAEGNTTKKKETVTKKEALAKEAGKQAAEATKAGRGFGLQQDAAEVLTQLLDLLGSPGGMRVKVKSLLQPVAGGNISFSTESQTAIALSLSGGVTSIAEALTRYTTLEEVTYQGKRHHKRLVLDSLPRVLTITLNRFRQGAKITREVAATDPLKIPRNCLSQDLKNQVKDQDVTYRLLHVVHHSGETPHSGHYTSYGRLQGTGDWYKHDDARWYARRAVPSAGALQSALSTGYIYVYVRTQ